MPNIPVIPGSSRVSSPELGVQVNAKPRLRALGQAAETFGAGAKAVSDAAQSIADYEQHKQRAEEVASFNQASIVLNKTTEDYRHNLPTMKDQQIVPDWTKIAGTTKQQILDDSKNLSPAAQKKLSQHLDTWAGNSTIEFQVASDHLATQRRKATATAASEQFLQSGDPAFIPNATAAIKAAQNAGDITPEEADQRIAQFPRVLQENQIRNGIEADPVRTLKDIDEGTFKDVPPGPLLTLKRQAQAAVSHQQNQGRDEILQRLDAGEPVDETEIQDKEEGGAISTTGAKSIRLRIQQKNLKDAKDEHSVQMMLAHDHDFTQDPDPAKTAQQMKDKGAALPPNLRASLYQEIDQQLAKAKKAGAAAEKPVQNDLYERGKKDYTSGLFQDPTEESTFHFFSPNEKKKVPAGVNPKWEQDATPEQKRAAELNYAKWQDKMRGFFKEYPDATSEQAEMYSQKIKEPYVMAAVAKAINQPVAGAPREIYSQAEFDSLKKGDSFIYNGRRGVKN